MANQSFIHNCIPSVASGKACVSDSLSVLRTMGTACHYSCESDPFSGREVAHPFSTNAVSAWVDGGVRTSGASHFLFPFDPLHIHLCLIPPLLSTLQTLDKMIVFVTLHTLPFGFFFLLPKPNPFKECQMSSSHTNLPLAPPTPTPILPASRNTTSFFMSNYSHRGATVKRQRRYSCQKGFELQEAMNYSKPFFQFSTEMKCQSLLLYFSQHHQLQATAGIRQGTDAFLHHDFSFPKVVVFSATNLFLLPLALILI